MKNSSQAGSHIVAVAFGIVVVAVLAFSGYKTWQMQQPAASTSNQPAATAAPSKIQNTSDLSKAAKYLDEASTQLNTNLDSNTFDADINSML